MLTLGMVEVCALKSASHIDDGLALNMWQAIILTTDDPFQWRIYTVQREGKITLHVLPRAMGISHSEIFMVSFAYDQASGRNYEILWRAPSAKKKDHQGVSSGVNSIWLLSNIDLYSCNDLPTVGQLEPSALTEVLLW